MVPHNLYRHPAERNRGSRSEASAESKHPCLYLDSGFHRAPCVPCGCQPFAGDVNRSSFKMTQQTQKSLPAGIRAIAALYALCAIYLGLTGVLMLVRPGAIPMSAGAPLLFGLELAGPYMFLLTALAGAAIVWGLLKLNNITRHVAMLIAITGIVMLMPAVSAATGAANVKALITGGAGIIVRVLVAWYLAQAEVVEHFRRAK
jgi:hypothetical protein